MNITLLEPQCIRQAHVPFNAALVRTILAALPDAGVTFSGESTHVTRVREELGDCPRASQIIWRNDFGRITRGGENLSALPRLLNAGVRLGRYCKDEKVDVLLLCSSSPALLASIIATRPRSTAAVVFLHACIAELRLNPLTQCVRNLLSMHAVARIPIPAGMRAVVLGHPILENMRAMGLASSRWESVDLPCLSGRDDTNEPSPLPVRFGYLAGFERSASDTKDMLERVRLSTGCGINWIGRDNASSEALSLEEYQRRLKEIHYAIWTGDPSTYRLRASATFLDAISLGKPLIYIKNDFIDYYNTQRGQFGLPVSSEAELEELMIRLARAPLDDNYQRMARAARDVGRTFSPDTIAPGLRSIIEAARDETKKQ
ncbi:MAG: hypothetical protein WCO94_15075 [Verrucomicrobiota bacterium]